MNSRVPFLSLMGLMLAGCGQPDPTTPIEGQGISHNDEALIYVDACKIARPDAWTYYPKSGDFFDQFISSDGTTYAGGGGIFSCNRFVVDVTIPNIPDEIIKWPNDQKGATIHWWPPIEASESPEICSTLRAEITVYSKHPPETSFTALKSMSLSYHWVPSSDPHHCKASGDWSMDFDAPMPAAPYTTYRFAVSVQYGGSLQPVSLMVGSMK